MGIRVIALLLVPFAVMAGTEDVREEIANADEMLKKIYLSPEVEQFCRENPDRVMSMEFERMPVRFECSVRNRWVELYRAGKIQVKIVQR